MCSPARHCTSYSCCRPVILLIFLTSTELLLLMCAWSSPLRSSVGSWQNISFAVVRFWQGQLKIGAGMPAADSDMAADGCTVPFFRCINTTDGVWIPDVMKILLRFLRLRSRRTLDEHVLGSCPLRDMTRERLGRGPKVAGCVAFPAMSDLQKEGLPDPVGPYTPLRLRSERSTPRRDFPLPALVTAPESCASTLRTPRQSQHQK
ncbi:hypothetical protein BCV70DRAFT_7113 [Testicularia cyperi]|uniref:Uncharacterized protein n=1 Tax=Testicularia cyperi TaxID=1882483 RepID=A0A317XY36_9BASI|nr:hypothetical protein BCV70DRAFT_7113 [Testicularia cyperi]